MNHPHPSPDEVAQIDPDGGFRQRLEADRTALRRLLDAAPGASTEARLEALVHRLAGAAGTFGYVDLGDVALALDDAFVVARESGAPHPDLAPLLAALEHALHGVSLRSA